MLVPSWKNAGGILYLSQALVLSANKGSGLFSLIQGLLRGGVWPLLNFGSSHDEGTMCVCVCVCVCVSV